MVEILEDMYMLETVLKNTENNHIIIKLLEFILNVKIKKIKYLGIEKFSSITEYDFSLAKINVWLQNNQEKRIYIRMIKGGKIKESIFCYWSLLYEKYLNSNKDEKKKITPNNVVITEKSIENNKKSIILTLNRSIKYNTEIILVEFKKFIIEKLKEKANLKGYLDFINNDDKNILFLGII